MITNHKEAVTRAKVVDKTNLDDVIFVGTSYASNVLTTLPSTYPKGDYRYAVCKTVKEGKAANLSLAEINRDNPMWERNAREIASSYYYGCTALVGIYKQK